MKRFVALGMVALMVTACENAMTPEVDDELNVLGRPDVQIVDPDSSYGYVDEFFSFLKPLVAFPQVNGSTLNTNLMPKIQVWEKGLLDLTMDDSDDPKPWRCEPLDDLDVPVLDVSPEPNADSTAYQYNWDTSDSELADTATYRMCVKVRVVGIQGTPTWELVGWRDVKPDKSTDSNDPSGKPYLFSNGSTIPVKFWLSSKSQCLDAVGNVIDCTIATFDSNGGQAYCDDAKCGIYVAPNAIAPDGLATFEVRYVKCDDPYVKVNGEDVDTLDTDMFLDIDIPQYPGCLTITTYANYDWSSYSSSNGTSLPDDIIAAACRDEFSLGDLDHRLLLHVEAPQTGNVYALPTRPFALDCTSIAMDDASLIERLEFYAKRGVQKVLPWVDPPELTAAHAGFGGGTSLSCKAPEFGPDGPEGIISGCSTPALADGDTPAGTALTFRMVWAMPSKISAMTIEETTSFGNPADWETWVNPFSADPNTTVYPAVYVSTECVDHDDEDGTCVEGPVEGATVRFAGDGIAANYTYTTGTDGIAYASMALGAGPEFSATAGGKGIGIDAGLAANVDPAATPSQYGAFQDHFGDNAILLESPRVKFDVSVCHDYRDVLSEPGVEYGNPGDPYHVVATIPLNISGAGETATLYMATDCYNTYFALEVEAAQDLQNALRIVFVDEQTHTVPDVWFSAVPVANVNGRWDDMWMIRRNDDKKSPTFGSWLLEDWHVSDDCTGSNKQSECGKKDTVQNLIPADGGPVHTVGTATVFEFARCFPGPENPTCPVATDAKDFPIPTAVGGSTKIAFYLVLQMGKGAQGNTEWPGFRLFQPFTIERK